MSRIEDGSTVSFIAGPFSSSNVGPLNGSDAHRPAFPGEQVSAEGGGGVGVEGAEPAEFVLGGREVAEGCLGQTPDDTV